MQRCREKFIALKTLIFENKRSLKRVKRFVNESLSIAEDFQSNTRLSGLPFARYTGRGLDFELRGPNSRLKSGCNVWQNFMIDLRMTLRASPRKRIRTYFLLTCLVESFPIGQERKHEIDFFAFFHTTTPFSINYSISKLNGHPSQWKGI